MFSRRASVRRVCACRRALLTSKEDTASQAVRHASHACREWPAEALAGVARSFLADVDFGPPVAAALEPVPPASAAAAGGGLEGVVSCCLAMHRSVETRSRRYFEELRRWVALLEMCSAGSAKEALVPTRRQGSPQNRNPAASQTCPLPGPPNPSQLQLRHPHQLPGAADNLPKAAGRETHRDDGAETAP